MPASRAARVCIAGEPNSKTRDRWPLPPPQPWPQKSCNFGSFDFAGFVKPAAFHYRSWWLAHIKATDPSRPPVCGAGGACDVVKIVHEWREPFPPIVAVYSNLPAVELLFNGVSMGTQPMGWANWTEWPVSSRVCARACVVRTCCTVCARVQHARVCEDCCAPDAGPRPS